MDRTLVDIVALTQETLELSDSYAEEPEKIFASFPEAVGVVYKIQKDGETFCIRGWPSSNIREDVISLYKKDARFSKILRVQHPDGPDLNRIAFFKTNSFEQAEAVVDEMINRRFPLKEESLINLGTLGPYWAMSFSDTRLVVYFNSQGIGENKQLIKLGPIGDNNVAVHCFRTLQEAFSSWHSQVEVTDFYCTKKSLELSCPHKSIFFESFKNLFLKGEYPKEGTFPFEILGRTFSYYLKEIATMRRFWIEIDRKLSRGKGD